MKTAIPGFSTLACSLGINEAMSNFGYLSRTLASAAGGVMCGIVGKKLGEYLVEEDYANIATVVENPEPQTQTWCSGTRGFGVKPSEQGGCGDKNQVSVTTERVSTRNGQQCRDYLTEVKTPKGKIETVTANTCDA